MEDEFKIFIDQLRKGHEKKFHEKLPASIMDINERDLEFKKDIELDGTAYLAENELILNWNIKAEALIACSICNEKVPVEIIIDNFYYSEQLSNIKSAVFNFKDVLRETILLETPLFAECNNGHCAKRRELGKYLKKEGDKTTVDDGYQPFADLK